MIRGKKPNPPALSVITGNRNRRARTTQQTPSAPRGIPPPFDHLRDEVKAAWMEIGRVLDDTRVVTLGHGHALEQMAENLVEIRELRAEIKKNGRFQTVRQTNGTKKQVVRPAVIALSDAEKRFRTFLEQFGMTALASSRVKIQPDEDEKNPNAKYFTPRPV